MFLFSEPLYCLQLVTF